MNVQEILNELLAAGAEQAQVTINDMTKHELNSENNKMALYRKVEEAKIDLVYMIGNRKAQTSINSKERSVIHQGIDQLKASIQTAQEDQAFRLPSQIEKTEIRGPQQVDLELMYDRMNDFNHYLDCTYPQIKADTVLAHVFSRKHIVNTNGMNVIESRCMHTLNLLYAANDKEDVTSFNYFETEIGELILPLQSYGNLNGMLDQAIKEFKPRAIGDKFIGDIIMAPLSFMELLNYVEELALKDHALLSNSSVYKNKRNKQIASNVLTWHSRPLDDSLANGYNFTLDGFQANNLTVIQDGILNDYLLTDYALSSLDIEGKTTNGGNSIVESGNKSLDELIKSVDRGVFISRFSSGFPSADGTISGVAKNSFYIENGQIIYPIKETMLTGNVFDMIMNINNLSRERINLGSGIVPWVHIKGVHISSQ